MPDEPETQKARDEPKNGREEGKGLGSFPATAVGVISDVAPVPNATTGEVIDAVDEEAEGSEPC